MVHHPWDFANFVQACAGIHNQHMPVETEGADQRAWYRQSPHTDSQAVEVEHRVAACGKDSVDDDRVHATTDHVDT